MFLGPDYLIGNDTGKRIFAAVRDLPILDPHNHADVAAIARNENFADAWELFAATDHYVWEVLRKAGVPEEKITGGASPHDKFISMANVFDTLAGNPVYEWIHLDLRFLGVTELLNAETGELIWQKVNAILAKDESRPQALLKRMNVGVMCSTDDPADTLEYHRSVNRDFGRTIVRPTWRPDMAMKAGSDGFPAYIERLGTRWGTRIASLDDLLAVLQKSHDFFEENGCRASDHGLELASSGTGDKAAAAETFRKVLAGESVSPEEVANYANWLLGEFGEMNSRSNWVTQLHIGAVRNVRDVLYRTIGPDSGGDVSDIHQSHEPALISFLNRFDGRLKIVLYCLDQGHQATLAALSRAFGGTVRLGSAWWLCDTPIGMKRQLEYIGSVDLLSAFAGMVSDSRKLLSYGSRFEMFRRILSSVLGGMVEAGQMPEPVALKLAGIICYEGPLAFFNL